MNPKKETIAIPAKIKKVAARAGTGSALMEREPMRMWWIVNEKGNSATRRSWRYTRASARG